MNLLRETWVEFQGKCINPAAGPVQRQEVRHAYYAGAHATLSLINAMAEMTPEQREHHAAALRVEIATFAATVGTTLEGHV